MIVYYKYIHFDIWYMWDLIHCKGDGLGLCYFDTSSQASKDDMHPVKQLADGSIFTFYWWMFHKKSANTTSYADPEMSDTW